MKDKLRVWKEQNPHERFHRMWRGECRDCLTTWQFWHWGAALGFGFQHRYQGCNKGPTSGARKRPLAVGAIMDTELHRLATKAIFAVPARRWEDDRGA